MLCKFVPDGNDGVCTVCGQRIADRADVARNGKLFANCFDKARVSPPVEKPPAPRVLTKERFLNAVRDFNDRPQPDDVTVEQYEERLTACEYCPSRKFSSCTFGCRAGMCSTLTILARRKGKKCPAGRWPEIPEPSTAETQR